MNNFDSYIKKWTKLLNAVALATLLTWSTNNNHQVSWYIAEPKERVYRPEYTCFVIQKWVHERIYKAMEQLSPNVEGSSEDLWLVLKNGEFSIVSLPGWNSKAIDHLDAYCKSPHNPATPETDNMIWGVFEGHIKQYGTYKERKGIDNR